MVRPPYLSEAPQKYEGVAAAEPRYGHLKCQCGLKIYQEAEYTDCQFECIEKCDGLQGLPIYDDISYLKLTNMSRLLSWAFIPALSQVNQGYLLCYFTDFA